MESGNDAISRVKAPAIGLIVVAVLNAAFAFLMLGSGLLRLLNVIDTGPAPMSGAERSGYLLGTFAGYAIAFICLVTAPVIVLGAFKMMNGKSYGLARAASVLAILPLTSCCFLAGIPIGIWSLILLSKPDVKSLFGRA